MRVLQVFFQHPLGCGDLTEESTGMSTYSWGYRSDSTAGICQDPIVQGVQEYWLSSLPLYPALDDSMVGFETFCG